MSESGEMACAGVTGWGDASAYVLYEGKLIIESSEGEDLAALTRSN